MQWIEGVKLTTLAPEEIRDLVKVGQEAFLVQLLEVWRGEKRLKFDLRRILASTDRTISLHSLTDRLFPRRPASWYVCGVVAKIFVSERERRGGVALSDAEIFFPSSIFFWASATSTSPPDSPPPPPSPLFSLPSPPTSIGNLLKVTSGPDAGKLCLLDFGLVAEVPEPDREAMVSATIHLANRDWASLVDDFVALDFLPAECDRGVIIPVMDRVLSPYLAGGGAKAFNFQVRFCERDVRE